MHLVRYIVVTLSLITIALLASCSHHPSHHAQGYIEGRYTYMATSVSGTLKQLLVTRGSRVHAGQVLFKLEEQPESDVYNAAVEDLKQSMAARDAITANLIYAKAMLERYKVLVPQRAIQKSQLDNAKATYDATLAQLAQANSNIQEAAATLAQAKWKKEQKIGIAPVDAFVFNVFYRLGEYTLANQSILSLLAPRDIKAIFFIEEINLGAIQLGDNVAVQCDGCSKMYNGHITFISPVAEFTPPVIYSRDTSSKLIYRIEANFADQDAYHLHPGQPVIVTYGR